MIDGKRRRERGWRNKRDGNGMEERRIRKRKVKREERHDINERRKNEGRKEGTMKGEDYVKEEEEEGDMRGVERDLKERESEEIRKERGGKT